MAYIKREKYTVIDDDDVKKEMLKALEEKGISSMKARQLVLYPTPMSLIRWAKWLDPGECKMFLEPYNEEEVQNEYVEEEENDESQDYFGF